MDEFTQIAFVALVTIAGSVLQGSLGVGLGILAAPLFALLAPAYVPGPLLASAFLLSVLVIWRDRSELRWAGAGWALLGRAPGIACGVALLVLFTQSAWLDVTLGLLLTSCVALAAAKGTLTVEPRRGWVFAAGLLSGTSGTAAGVGGPPVALVWSRLPAKRRRSTLAAYFLVGTFASACVLLLTGQFGDPTTLAVMVPSVCIGFFLSNVLDSRIDADNVRTAVLVLSGSSSLILLVRGLLAV